MKKIISILLSIIITISFSFGANIPAHAANTVANGTCGSGLTWILDENGTITISGSGSRMNDYRNNSLSPWYNYREQITKAVIEDGVINIGSMAFMGCTNLKEVYFGTIDTIGDHAFMNCSSLKHAILPNSCVWIWANAFENCTSLQSAYIDSVKSYESTVPEGIFKGCASLSVLGLGESISKIGTDALSGCSSLSSIISDNANIQALDYNTTSWESLSGVCSENTYSSDKLTWNYDFDSSLLYFTGSGDMNLYNFESQPWYNFYGAINTVDFSSTDAQTSTSTDCFKDMKSLEKVDFTNVYSIGWRSFGGCASLGNIEFDSTLKEIWGYAFEKDTSINEIRFKDGYDELSIRDHAFSDCTGTTFWLNLPSNIRYIGDEAFLNTGFNYVTFASEKVELGSDAFGNKRTDFFARFLGPGGVDNGVYSWVKQARKNNNYNWHYNCLSDHIYGTVTVEPTCKEQGYDRYGCLYCDEGEYNANFTPAIGHSFRCIGKDGANFIYNCARCGEQNLELSSIEASILFEPAISTKAGDLKYKQKDYDSRVDIDYNGVINAKDFVMIHRAIADLDTTNKETILDTSTTYQTIEGFGASAAWWSQYVGNWENAEDIIGLLYSDKNGIGLNIYRYNLGGGSEDQKDYNLYVSDARTHCFLQPGGTYNWNNDEGAMNSLRMAQGFNPDLKLTLFSNSPPYFMTKNGKTYGALTKNDDGSASGNSNLDSAQYQAFANYVANCAEHFIDEGYNVTEVSPINEPEWDWSGWFNGDGSQSSNQEGCHWTWSEALNFYNNYMVPALTSNAKLNGKVDLAVWESGQLNHQWLWNDLLNNLFSSKDYDSLLFGAIKIGDGYAKANKNIRNYTDVLDTHSYWASTDDRYAVASQLSGEFFGQKVKASEYCQMTNDPSSGVLGHIQAEGSTNGMTIDYGLALADIIYQDLTILNAVEWDWWTGCGKGIYTDSLVYINENNREDVQTSKRLWCLGNYSKFIDEGAKRIKVETASDFGANLKTNQTYAWKFTDDNGNVTDSGVDKNNYIEQSAYLNPDGSVVIVYINNSDTIEYTSIKNNEYSAFKSYVTSETMDLKEFQSGDIADNVCIPARSVTTVVLNK